MSLETNNFSFVSFIFFWVSFNFTCNSSILLWYSSIFASKLSTCFNVSVNSMFISSFCSLASSIASFKTLFLPWSSSKFSAIPAIAAFGIWITIIIGIVVFVLTIISEYRLAKAYGHGGGYTVGLIFLNFIFMLILGFGKSEYQGNVYLKK